MSRSRVEVVADDAEVGARMYRFMGALYPICRSITGDGVRQTLAAIGSRIPLTIHAVPSGTQVLDWIVPREWNIRDAYIGNSSGRRVVDFAKSNLHVVGYSVPIKRRMRLAELRGHLHSLPEHPDWIPYRTSYYNENWGFCLTHRQLSELPDDDYEVCVDSSLTEGELVWGECRIGGAISAEVLISCHVCHPSLCNDNLSGIALATELAAELVQRRPHYSYRFLFVPGTIGSIAWLARNEGATGRIRHGLVVTSVGDGARFTYKKSRGGDADVDRAVEHVLRHSGYGYTIESFSPYGYDERQYNSPGFDLPVGCLMRSAHAAYPEYHTSADDLDFARPVNLAQSLDCYRAVLRVLEGDRVYVNASSKGEPQLGRRGLYQAIGGDPQAARNNMAMLWVLNQSDGRHSLLDVARRADLPFDTIRAAATTLQTHGLLFEATHASVHSADVAPSR